MKRLSVSEPELSGNEERYVVDCVRNAKLSMGGYVHEFEALFAHQTGVLNAVAVSNGTVALHLALVALGVGPGDEVLVPALTYVSTANAVTYCGATPIFCDVDPGTWCIDPIDARRRITARTRGIILVHLYGHPANVDAFRWVTSRGIWLLEDAAEAHGARYKDRPVGSLGVMGTFSFYGNKILACGEGGMITTENDELAKKLRLYRGQGVDTSVHRYHHTVVGFNYRMSNLIGAIGLAQLEQLEQKLARRRQIQTWYYEWAIGGLNPGFVMQDTDFEVLQSHWLFTMLVPAGVDRDWLMRMLNERGIETRPTFQCMHRLPIYQCDESFPVAEMVAERGISLPTHTKLSQMDVRRVCNALTDLTCPPD